jgi:hypothetical protein
MSDYMPPLPEPTVGLLSLVHSLDALYEIVKALPSPMPKEDSVPIIDKARVLGILALQRITDDQGAVLQRLLHSDFFDQETKPEYPSFVARSSIAVLLGFLRGCLAEAEIEAQRDANAHAYAEQKLREERGVGFRSPST